MLIPMRGLVRLPALAGFWPRNPLLADRSQPAFQGSPYPFRKQKIDQLELLTHPGFRRALLGFPSGSLRAYAMHRVV